MMIWNLPAAPGAPPASSPLACAGQQGLSGAPARCARAAWRGIPLVLLAASLLGCQPAINWREYAYDRNETLKRAGGKPIFVYLRSWASVECTRFEDQVLSDPTVRTATTDLYCVVLEFAPDADLAQQWRLDRPPAIAILSPSGEVLSAKAGATSKEELRQMIEAAKTRLREQAPDSTP